MRTLDEVLKIADVEMITETLSDGSKVFGVRIGGKVFDCYSERHAIGLCHSVAVAMKNNCPGSCRTVIDL